MQEGEEVQRQGGGGGLLVDLGDQVDYEHQEVVVGIVGEHLQLLGVVGQSVYVLLGYQLHLVHHGVTHVNRQHFYLLSISQHNDHSELRVDILSPPNHLVLEIVHKTSQVLRVEPDVAHH